MTLLQAYLIGVAFMGVISALAVSHPRYPRGPFTFAASLMAMLLWPLLPVFIIVGKKITERETR